MATPLEVTVQATPNPHAAKFTLNRIVSAQGKTYRLPATPQHVGGAQRGEADAGMPGWAQALLSIPGVTQVFAINNFISVNKTPDADWSIIGPRVEQALKDAFA